MIQWLQDDNKPLHTVLICFDPNWIVGIATHHYFFFQDGITFLGPNLHSKENNIEITHWEFFLPTIKDGASSICGIEFASAFLTNCHQMRIVPRWPPGISINSNVLIARIYYIYNYITLNIYIYIFIIYMHNSNLFLLPGFTCGEKQVLLMQPVSLLFWPSMF